MTTKIEALKAALAAATPGTWTAVEGPIRRAATYIAKLGDETIVDSDTEDEIMGDTALFDAEFIALAHNLMPQLLNAIALLQFVERAYAEVIDTDTPIDGGDAVDFLVQFITNDVRPLLTQLEAS